MADEKVYGSSEWRQELAKALRERVDAYGKKMLELRQRELKKAEPSEPAPALKPVDSCPTCGNEDVPGKCSCLRKAIIGTGGGALPAPAPPPPPPAPIAKQAKKAETLMKPCGTKKAEEKPNAPKPEEHTWPKGSSCPDCAAGKKHLHDKDAWKPKSGEVKKTQALPVGQDDVPLARKEKLATKPKEPVKAPEGGNGIKVKALEKAKLPGVGATPIGKLTRPGDNSRANMLSHFTSPSTAGHAPAGAPPKPAAPAPAAAAKPKGLAAVAAVGKQPIVPTAASPAPGVGGLKPPPAPVAAAPKPKGLAAVAAAGKQPIAPTTVAPKAPAMKSEMTKSELGDCPLCKKSEHSGDCKP